MELNCSHQILKKMTRLYLKLRLSTMASAKSLKTYREYLIKNDLRSAAYEKWYNGLVEAVPMTMGDTRYIRTDLVMNTNG